MLSRDVIEILSSGKEASCRSSRETKEEVYNQIRRDVDLMEETILTLKKRHNSLSNVSRLPAELLAKIFKWDLSMERVEMVYNKMIYNKRDLTVERPKPTPWLRVTRVCTEWRRVALECPALWTFYHISSLDILQTVISRSGVLPLYINMYLFRQSSKGFRGALREIHRIRELSLSASGGLYWNKLGKAFAKAEAAPLLETFKMRMQYAKKTVTLPDHLFADTAPRLEDLELESCKIGSNTSILPGLKGLKMTGLHNANGLSFSQLLELLKQTPNLERLELEDACIDEEVDASSAGRLVQLPHLQFVEIIGSMCTVIFSQIILPTVSRVSLKLSRSYREDSIQSLCNILGARIQPVCIRVGRRFVDLWAKNSIHSRNLLLETPDVHISAYAHGVITSSGVPIYRILDNLSLAALQVLFIDDHTPTKKMWLETFGNLESLSTIHIKNKSTYSFFEALQKTYPVTVDGGVRSSFKRLRTLIIEGSIFNAKTIDTLVRCLRELHSRGPRLKRIHILRGKFNGSDSDAAAAKLRETVQEVEWHVQEDVGGTLCLTDAGRISPDSSPEIEAWDYSSPEENFPYVFSASDDESI